MPSNYPRAPVPLLAILAAPITWLYGRPDLFDSYRSALLLHVTPTETWWRKYAWQHAGSGLVSAVQRGRGSGLLFVALCTGNPLERRIGEGLHSGMSHEGTGESWPECSLSILC